MPACSVVSTPEELMGIAVAAAVAKVPSPPAINDATAKTPKVRAV